MVHKREIVFNELTPSLAGDRLFKTDEDPLPSRPEGAATLVDLGVEPGRSTWSLWRFAPGAEVGMHHTDTVDLEILVEGSIELILDDGSHPLQAGDCVVMNGVDHGWRTGPAGCLVSAVAIGTPPRDQ